MLLKIKSHLGLLLSTLFKSVAYPPDLFEMNSGGVSFFQIEATIRHLHFDFRASDALFGKMYY